VTAPTIYPLIALGLTALAGALSLTNILVAEAATLIASIISLVASLLAVLGITTGHPLLEGELWLDPYSAWMMLLVSVVYLLTALPSIHLTRRGGLAGLKGESYYLLVNAAFFAMFTIALFNDLFLAWILLEICTILTVYLVCIKGGGASVEAAWKYFMICAVGMSFSLYGLVTIYSIGASAGVPEPWRWTSLATHLDVIASNPRSLIAFMFILAGFSVKAGLFPLHFWLPDAYAEAPTPVSVLLAGALTFLPLYVLLRISYIIPAGSPVYLLLLVVSVATILYASAGMLITRDVKRLLAYSSMEHMGLMSFMIYLAHEGAPGLALLAFAVHSMGHAIAKSAAFVSSGFIEEYRGSRRIEDIIPVYEADWLIGGSLIAFLLALLGCPPFPLFISELLAAASCTHALILTLYIAVILAAFAALAYRMVYMLRHRRGDGGDPPQPRGRSCPACYRTAVYTALAMLIALTIAAPLLAQLGRPLTLWIAG